MNASQIFNILLLLTSLSSCREKDPIEINSSEEFVDFLEEEMRVQDIPAMSVLIFKEEEILLEKYFGKSNLEQSISLESKDLFLLASVSKTITAAALLQLYDRDSFELDDNINNYLPFQLEVPNQKTNITFRMLLTHTSGIADGEALDGQYFYGKDSPVELGFFLENYLKAGGQFYNASENFHGFEPGTEHEYTNVGNALIGWLVERISGMNFNAFCKQNLFIPLGMTNTFWRLDEINQTIVQPYDFDNDGNNMAIEHYTFTDYPNGGLRSNVTDMFHFISGLAQKGTYNNVRFLEESTVDLMASSQIPQLEKGVGLHLFIMNSQYNLWGHDGGEQGVATIMAYHPDTQIGALVFTNQGEANLDTILREAYKLGLGL